MTTLAVVMATYNGARFLPEQLESIARQTRPPDLLLVSDDGSEDDSCGIVERFTRTASFETRLIHGPGDGLAANFWQAAIRVDTDLIAWADQDDRWLPSKLERCENELLSAGAGFVSHSALTVDMSGQSLRRKYPHYRSMQRRGALEGDPWHVPSGFASMFRASLVRNVPFEERPRSHQTQRPMNHDHMVSLRAFSTCVRVELDEVLALYRQHPSNAAGDPTPSGLAALRQTVGPRAREFLQLASIASEYGSFVSRLSLSRDAALYFDDLSARCRERAEIYSTSTVKDRFRKTAGAWRRGVYGPKIRGGFGPPALIRDAALSLATSVLPRSGT
jgi:glycosyltransferase involved in cell wall biosynthesis